MRRNLPWLAAAALAAVLLPACGGDEPAAAPSPTATAKPRPVKQANAAQLKAALPVLLRSDGWLPVPADATDDEEIVFDGCAALEGIGEISPTVPGAKAAFAHGAARLYFASSVESHRTLHAATELMAEMRDAYRECPSFRMTGADGLVMRVSMSQVSFPGLCDDQYALLLDFSQQKVRGSMTLAACRLNNHVVTLMGGQAGDAADVQEMDPKLWDGLARGAVAKAKRALPL